MEVVKNVRIYSVQTGTKNIRGYAHNQFTYWTAHHKDDN